MLVFSKSRRPIGRALVSAMLVLLAACGNDAVAPAPTPTDPQQPSPSLIGRFDLQRVNDANLPAITVDAQVGPTKLRGEITSGHLQLNADSSFALVQRARLWNNGTLIQDNTSNTSGQWRYVNSQVQLTTSAGTAITLQRVGAQLTLVRDVVTGPINDSRTESWPFLYVRN